MEEESLALRSAGLGDLQAVAVRAKMPIAAADRPIEGCLHFGAERGFEIDSLVTAAVLHVRGNLLVIIQRRILEAQLHFAALRLVEAGKSGSSRLESIGA